MANQVSDRHMPSQQQKHGIGDDLLIREVFACSAGIDQGAEEIGLWLGAALRQQPLRLVDHRRGTLGYTSSRVHGNGDNIEEINEVDRPLYDLAAILLMHA